MAISHCPMLSMLDETTAERYTEIAENMKIFTKSIAELRIEMHGSMGVIKCQCVNLIHSVSVCTWKWCPCHCPRRRPNAIKTQCIDAFIGYDCITTSDATEIIYRNETMHITFQRDFHNFIL